MVALIDDLVSIISIYTTATVTYNLLLVIPQRAYRAYTWKNKLLAERKGNIAQDAVTSVAYWSKYYRLTTTRIGGIFLELGPTNSFTGAVNTAVVSRDVAWIVTGEGRLLSRLINDSYIYWSAVNIPERVVAVAATTKGYTAVALTEKSNIYIVRAAGRTLTSSITAPSGCIDVKLVSGESEYDASNAYALGRDGVVYSIGLDGKSVSRLNRVLSMFFTAYNMLVQYFDLRAASYDGVNQPKSYRQQHKLIMSVSTVYEDILLDTDGALSNDQGATGSNIWQSLRVYSESYKFTYNTGIITYDKNDGTGIRTIGRGFALHSNNPEYTYIGMIVEPQDPSIQRVPGNAILPINAHGVVTLNGTWDDNVYYAVPPPEDIYNDPEAVNDAAREQNQSLNDYQEEIEDLTGLDTY